MHHGVELVERCVRERLVVADASVVDEDIDAAEGAKGGIAGSRRGSRVCGVAGNGDGPGEGLGELLQGFCAAGDEDDVCAGFGEECGGGAAKAGAGAGNDCDLAAEWCGDVWWLGHEVYCAPASMTRDA